MTNGDSSGGGIFPFGFRTWVLRANEVLDPLENCCDAGCDAPAPTAEEIAGKPAGYVFKKGCEPLA